MAYELQSPEEEKFMWDQCMNMLEYDMKWVLENLEKLQTFRVGWNHYGRHKIQCSNCLKHNEVTVDFCKECGKTLKNERIVTFGVGKPTHL